MLDFIQRYQRLFLIAIATIIITSFVLFGIQSPFHLFSREGSHLHKTTDVVEALTRIIASDRYDYPMGEKGRTPNPFNDGVIRKDLLSSGLGVLLADAHFDKLEDDLNLRYEQQRRFRPYRHPTMPAISAENLWKQLLPSKKEHLDRFRYGTRKADRDTFALLVDLYLDEMAFPPTTLRKYLAIQEKFFNRESPPDPELPHIDLNLFHCTSLEEWFGANFLALCAHFLHQSARFAREMGYAISREEARIDLLHNGFESLCRQGHRALPTDRTIRSLLKKQLDLLQIEEETALEAWKEIMLFRSLFEDCREAIAIDPHLYQTLHAFAAQTTEIDLYTPPPALTLEDEGDLLKFQLYLNAISLEPSSLQLPRRCKSIEEVEGACPELVEERFLVEMAEITLDEVANGISMRETWKWQLEGENQPVLDRAFPDLKLGHSTIPPYDILEGLDREEREQVDRFSRETITRHNPQWIQEALLQKELTTKKLSFSPDAKWIAIEDRPIELERGKELLHLLKATPLKGELTEERSAIDARQTLEGWSPDGMTYYRLHLLDRDRKKEVLTFVEAKKRGILDHLLKLERGGELSVDLLRGIEDSYRFSSIAHRDESVDEGNFPYVQYRFLNHMLQMANAIIHPEGEPPLFLKEGPIPFGKGLPPKPPLEEQWSLRKETLLLKKGEKRARIARDPFAMEENSWSPVENSPENTLHFFHVKSHRSQPIQPPMQAIREGRRFIGREAQLALMTKVLEKIEEEGGLFPTSTQTAEGDLPSATF